MDDAEFVALYGAWAPRTPYDVAALFDGYPALWWIAGGWALEAFTRIPRAHGDIDPSILRDDLPALRRHLAGRLHLWSAYSGALKPLPVDDRFDAPADEVLPPGTGQLWARPDAAQPWEYDILLSPGTDDEWVYKRDATIRMPMRDALWERDGIRYLQPEIQLLMKAKGLRPKDAEDFAAASPMLDDDRRAWLRAALERTLPSHPWIAEL